MAERSEALAQLARLLRDPAIRNASHDSVSSAIDQHFQVLVDSLVDETAASDDVLDRDSALSYVESRVIFLSSVLTPEQARKLREAATERLATW